VNCGVLFEVRIKFLNRTHPEGPATGQMGQGFPWFSSVLKANAELVPKFHVTLHASREALSVLT
jgi:hypothetical protein